jgi:hypothetical protein
MSIPTTAQVVAQVNGFNRMLTWNDFRTVQQSLAPPMEASTSSSYSADWDISVPGVLVPGREYSLSNVRAKVIFDQKLSWVVEGSQSDDLLKHEQGHLDITKIIARDLCRRLMSEEMVVNLNGQKANDYLMAQANGMMARAQALLLALQSNPVNGMRHDGLYDTMTVHGTDSDAQARWTDVFQHALTTDTSLTLTMVVFEIVPMTSLGANLFI